MSKFTRIPENTFKEIVINAGLLATNFNPKTAEVAESELMGATSGGTSFAATPSFIDYGEDIDNCPANTMELKRIDSIEAKLSGTFVTLNTALGKKLAAAADETEGKIVPRSALSERTSPTSGSSAITRARTATAISPSASSTRSTRAVCKSRRRTRPRASSRSSSRATTQSRTPRLCPTSCISNRRLEPNHEAGEP